MLYPPSLEERNPTSDEYLLAVVLGVGGASIHVEVALHSPICAHFVQHPAAIGLDSADGLGT